MLVACNIIVAFCHFLVLSVLEFFTTSLKCRPLYLTHINLTSAIKDYFHLAVLFDILLFYFLNYVKSCNIYILLYYFIGQYSFILLIYIYYVLCMYYVLLIYIYYVWVLYSTHLYLLKYFHCLFKFHFHFNFIFILLNLYSVQMHISCLWTAHFHMC